MYIKLYAGTFIHKVDTFYENKHSVVARINTMFQIRCHTGHFPFSYRVSIFFLTYKNSKSLSIDMYFNRNTRLRSTNAKNFHVEPPHCADQQ